MMDKEVLERIEALELEANRALAYSEVQNVAHRFCWYHQSFRDDLIISEGLWAKKAPDIHSEHGPSGVYQGYDSVIKWHQGRPTPPGKILFHAYTTPIIEIAGDCKTAKGVWLMAGAEGGAMPADVNKDEEVVPESTMVGAEAGSKFRNWATWAWCKYAIDFIVEDGQWKIWHFHCYDLLRASYDMDWVSWAQRYADLPPKSEEAARGVKFYDDKGNVVYVEKADAPSTFTWRYNGKDSKYFLFPEPPKPYNTFS